MYYRAGSYLNSDLKSNSYASAQPIGDATVSSTLMGLRHLRFSRLLPVSLMQLPEFGSERAEQGNTRLDFQSLWSSSERHQLASNYHTIKVEKHRPRGL